jgi:hypothetical protein
LSLELDGWMRDASLFTAVVALGLAPVRAAGRDAQRGVLAAPALVASRASRTSRRASPPEASAGAQRIARGARRRGPSRVRGSVAEGDGQRVGERDVRAVGVLRIAIPNWNQRVVSTSPAATGIE